MPADLRVVVSGVAGVCYARGLNFASLTGVCCRVQAHELSKYGVMPPESDSKRDWRAWYREATDKAQLVSEEVAMLATPLLDAPHRWDHGHPGDWCGTGGCRTLAHEQRGDRYANREAYVPDKLERSITSKLQDAVLAGTDDSGRTPTEVTVSGDMDRAPVDYREGRDRYEGGREVRRGEEGNDEVHHQHDSYPEGRHKQGERAKREEEEWRGEAREQERDEEEEEREPANKHLARKVDELQDEMSELVKILARRKVARLSEEGGEGREPQEREHEHDERREPQERGSEHDHRREEEEARAPSKPQAHGQQFAARNVVDWLRGAARAARV